MPQAVRKSRNRRRRRDKNFVAIPFDQTLTLSTLADSAALAPTGFATLGEDLYVVSADVEAAMSGHTAGEGPIRLVMCHGDLSAAEVVENLDASLSDPDDIIAREHARRPVRMAGTFHGLNTEEVLNNGVKQRIKARFSVGDGHFLGFTAQNRSGAPLTTGTLIKIYGVVYGRWQR